MEGGKLKMEGGKLKMEGEKMSRGPFLSLTFQNH